MHGFIDRDTPGYQILDDWDTLGMRASQSNTTVLDGAVVPRRTGSSGNCRWAPTRIR